MTTITLDRVKQLVPHEYVKFVNDVCFEPVIRQDKMTSDVLDTGEFTVPRSLLNEHVGINAINYSPQGVIIDYTGKVVADRGYLGLIDINNVELAFQKLQDSLFVSFTSPEDLLSSQVLYVDVTKDVEVEDKAKTLQAISYYAELNRKCKMKKYNNSGIIFPTIANSRKDSLVIYDNA